MLNALIVPRLGKERTVFAEAIDEGFDPRVAKRVTVIRAEFRQKSLRPILPIRDEPLRGRRQEDEAQQVALMVPIQPATEEPRRRLVPSAGVPKPVETIGRMPDGLDQGQQRRRRIRLWRRRPFRIKTTGKLEQIGAFSARQ